MRIQDRRDTIREHPAHRQQRTDPEVTWPCHRLAITHDHGGIVPRFDLVRRLGSVRQIVLLAALAATVGLGAAGWVAGVTYGVVPVRRCSPWRSHRASPCSVRSGRPGDPGPGDARRRGDRAHRRTRSSRPAPVAVLVAIAVVALVLDAVDGQVARRTGTASALGARFDMEVDAFLILVLSVYVARSLGAWVLAIGAMRYAFVAASWVCRGCVDHSRRRYWRKVVAATQGVVLVVAAAGVIPRPLMAAALVVALALLVESFGRDVRWLWRRR